jgi:hypothetical protein
MFEREEVRYRLTGLIFTSKPLLPQSQEEAM